MSSYATMNGFKIKSGRRCCNQFQFADGSIQETVGQVYTSWTFSDGKRIPITFEVLENCASDVIIGSEIIFEHNIFQKYASSITTEVSKRNFHELAPFDFIKPWQRSLERTKRILKLKMDTGNTINTDDFNAAEKRRREEWDCEYDFGRRASTSEQDAENRRREQYKAKKSQSQTTSTGHSSIPQIPSIPTSNASRHS
ncbi:MAG: hypothetical protein M1834_004760 [Cirrosporium novae-zelandiae]|nr:MAG: hypothetical protein M1834_004760 [Cirrosporium novae-zelandiae]